MGRDKKLLAVFKDLIMPGEITPGFSPTFGGALNWTRRHRHVITTMVRLLKTYPNMIHDSCLDDLWHFLLPYLSNAALGQEGARNDRSEPHGQKTTRDHQSRNKTPGANFSLPVVETTVYVSDVLLYLCSPPLEDTAVKDLVKTQMLINSLLPYCYMRVNNPPYYSGNHQQQARKDEGTSLENVHAFVYLMSGKTLASRNCTESLCAALRNNIPVIAVRDPGYKLPTKLPEHIAKHAPVRRKAHLKAGESYSSYLNQRDNTSKRSTPISPFQGGYQSPGSRPQSSSSDVSHVCSAPQSPTYCLTPSAVDNTPYGTSLPLSPAKFLGVPDNVQTAFPFPSDAVSLVDIMQELYRDSVVYLSEFHKPCILNLYKKLGSTVGCGSFPTESPTPNNAKVVCTPQPTAIKQVHEKMSKLSQINFRPDFSGKFDGNAAGELSPHVTPLRPVDISLQSGGGDGSLKRSSSTSNVKSMASGKPPLLPPLASSRPRSHTMSGSVKRPVSHTANVRVPTCNTEDTKEDEGCLILETLVKSSSPETLENKKTSYVLFHRDKTKAPSIIKWPVKEDILKPSWDLFSSDDYDDFAILPGSVCVDIDLRSESTSPDL